MGEERKERGNGDRNSEGKKEGLGKGEKKESGGMEERKVEEG